MDFPTFADPEESPVDDIDVDAIMDDEERQQAQAQAMAERLQLFSAAVAKTRKHYVDGRRASGLEKEWLEAEDAYNSIDDANRSAAAMMDAVAAGGPIVNNKAKPTRSTVFVGVTRQKTNVAEARIADILLPTDDRNWGIKPSPKPELTAAIKREQQAEQQAMSAQMQQPVQSPALAQQTPVAQAAGQAMQPSQPENMPWTPGQPQPGMVVQQPGQTKAASQIWDEALQAAEAMQDTIEDALIDCDWNGIQRKVIHDAAVLGTGVCKGPFATSTIKRAWTPVKDITGNVVQVLEIKEELNASSAWVSLWNFFPDPSCGDNIHDGGGAMELKFLTPRKVRELAKQPGYLKDQIAQVLEEGPRQATGAIDARIMARMRAEDPALINGQSSLYEVWEYWGEFDAEDLKAAGVDVGTDPLKAMSGCVVMINDTIVKAFLHPMETGELPYDVYVWEKRANSWAGYGVPHLVKWQQRVINSAWRMMMDNAGSVVGDQIVVKSGVIQPADQRWEISGRKVWWCTDESIDVRNAFATFSFNSHQNDYAQIIQMAEQFMDSESGVPQIAQGEHDGVPDTVGGMQILMASANTVVRRLVKQYDDMITRPHLRRYYDWMMEHNPNPEIKGDFQVDARGSSALVTRDIQNQAFINLMNLAQNPIYGVYIDPKKLFEKALQAQHIDPAEIMRADEEIDEIQKQQAGKGPTDPKVQAAMINAQAHLQVAQARNQGQLALQQARSQATMAIEQTRAQAEIAYANTEAQMAKDNQAGDVLKLQMQERLAMLTYANQHQMTIQQINAELAKVQMQEQTKRELAQTELQMAAMENERSRRHDINMHHLQTVTDAANPPDVMPGMPATQE